jgi:hypothetical protein
MLAASRLQVLGTYADTTQHGSVERIEKPKRVAQDTVKACHDPIWRETNESTLAMMHETGAPIDAMLARHLEQQAAAQAASQERRKQSASLRAERICLLRPNWFYVLSKKAPEVELLEASQVRKPIEMKTKVDKSVVMDLETQAHRNRVAALQRTMAKSSRVNPTAVINAPAVVGQFAYLDTLSPEQTWIRYIGSHHPELTFPDSPELERAYIVHFLREPDVRAGERACFNLDRPPRQGESLPQCASFLCTAMRYGPDRARKFREFLIDPEAAARMRASKDRGLPPTALNTDLPQMCILCHLRLYQEAAQGCASDEMTKQRKNLASSNYDQRTGIIINSFCVIVDSPGEYASSAMHLSKIENGMGIWGFVPEYSPDNYMIPGPDYAYPDPSKRHLLHLIESDRMLFWHTREPLPRIESSNMTTSSRSSRTGKHILTGISRQ